MGLKTKVKAEDAKQELTITRDFDLPVDLLFKAYTEAELLEQWMGTKAVKLESKVHGGYQFETSDAHGNVVFRANGVIHEFEPNRKITRTFEMENSPQPYMANDAMVMTGWLACRRVAAVCTCWRPARAHSGQWNPTDAGCMQSGQMGRPQRWQPTPVERSGCR